MDRENAAKTRQDLSFKKHNEEAKTRWKEYRGKAAGKLIGSTQISKGFTRKG